jgi:hypothetical protein
MGVICKCYRFINILSIDVALGSVCCALFFGKVFGVRAETLELLTLAFAVWVVYTLDHLLDAKRIQSIAATERHRFHQQNFTVLLRVVIVVSFINAVFICFLRQQILVSGLMLAGFVCLYLFIQHYIKFLKELFIAILYTIGILLPTVAQDNVVVEKIPWILVIQFVLLALLNLLVFAWYDRTNDQQNGLNSLVRMLGDRKVKFLLHAIILAIFALTFFTTSIAASYVLLVMSALQLLIYYKPSYFSVNNRFRLVGDATFMLPILYLTF